MNRPMNIEIADILAQLRTGELEMIYARPDKRTDLIYCTVRPRRPVLPATAGVKPLWLADEESTG